VKRILLIVVGVLVLLVAGVLVAVMLKPKEFHIERSITTSASPSAVFAVISDFQRWPEWSPWQELDPNAKTEVVGSGVGSTLSWDGNDDVGAGKMIIVGLTPDKAVDLKLEFSRPFPATNTTVWRIDDEGDQRRITWSMDGASEGLLPRVVCLFINMDKVVGKDFEKGLASLKALVER